MDKISYFIFQTASLDVIAVIQLTVLLFGYIRSSNPKEEMITRLDGEGSELMFTDEDSTMSDKLGSLVDTFFDPPLLRRSTANFGWKAA